MLLNEMDKCVGKPIVNLQFWSLSTSHLWMWFLFTQTKIQIEVTYGMSMYTTIPSSIGLEPQVLPMKFLVARVPVAKKNQLKLQNRPPNQVYPKATTNKNSASLGFWMVLGNSQRPPCQLSSATGCTNPAFGGHVREQQTSPSHSQNHHKRAVSTIKNELDLWHCFSNWQS